MATIKIILAMLCFAFIGRSNVFNGHLLKQPTVERERIMAIARAEIGTREATGNNDGKRVEEYLATVKLRKGNPYCAAFVSFIFNNAGYSLPRTGWSPALFPKNRLTNDILPANLFSIYFTSLRRVAHVGFVDRQKGDWVITVEANTSYSGARNGDGVFKRIRHIKTIHSFSDWTGKGVAK